jgi:TetR/AcrR family transcriptional regulator
MSIADRREHEKEIRKKEILNAAENLFFSKGYEDVSLNEIANKVNLGRSTLYLYFENKEELFFAIVLRGTIILHNLIKSYTKDSKNSIQRLEGFRKAYFTFAQEYPNYLQAYNYLFSGRFDLESIKTKEYKIPTISESKFYEDYKKILDGNLVNFPIPKSSTGEYLTEIMGLRCEMLNILYTSIENGKSEGFIRSNVNSATATVLLTLIANNTDNLSFDLNKMLINHDIGHEQFVMDISEFIGYMLSNKVTDKLI